ncbi:hypothetical protein Tco_1107537 [Tanacetum coccineum]
MEILHEPTTNQALVGDLQEFYNESELVNTGYQFWSKLAMHSESNTSLLEDHTFELANLSRSIFLNLLDHRFLDDGVAALFQKSRIHKPHAHTQAFKVNHSMPR